MLKKGLYLFLFLCSFIPQSCFSQAGIDSLKLKLSNTGQTKERVDVLNTLAKLIIPNSPDKALEYAHEALSLSKKINYDPGTSVSYRYVGTIYIYKSEYALALAYMDSALVIADLTKNNLGAAETKAAIGTVFLQQGKFDKALDFLSTALHLFEKEKDQAGMARCYNNIGNIYYFLKNLDEALNYYKLAADICIPTNNKSLLAKLYNGMGVIYSVKKEFDKALQIYEKAAKITEETGDNTTLFGIWNNIANIYYSQKKYKEAMFFFQRYSKMANSIQDKKGVATSYNNIAECYQKLNEVNNAVAYYNRALAIADSFNIFQQRFTAYTGLSEVYETKKDYKTAFHNYRKAMTWKDSLSNQDVTKRITKITAKLDAEKKEKENELKQLAIDIEHKSQIKRQKIITFSVIIALLLSLFLVYFIFRGFRQKKKANLALEEINKIIEEKNKDITDSITYAQRIQSAILPSDEFIKQYLPGSFIYYKPKDIVAGDFYWMHVLSSQKEKSESILIAAADCTGHGVPGAMVSVVCSNALNISVKEFGITEPGKILDKVRELVLETFSKSGSEVKDGMDISLCSIQPTPGSENLTIQWAGANNPLWYLQKKFPERNDPQGESEDMLKEIKPDKQPVGKIDDPKPFTTHSITLKKNDTLFLFTDGYADQFGGTKGKKYKYKQLEELLKTNASKSAEEQKEILNAAFTNWKGNLEQVDDILIIGIKV
jgi:tetratricopeptide (TPR) repeat protein